MCVLDVVQRNPFFQRLCATASLSALSHGHKDNSDDPFIFLTSCRLQEERWLLPRLFMALLISRSYICSSLRHMRVGACTPSHITHHCTSSSIHLLFLDIFCSCFIAFIPQIVLICTHIDEATHLSGSRKWMELDVRVIWSMMSSVNLLNRHLWTLKSFANEVRWANWAGVPNLGLFLRQRRREMYNE